MLRKRVHFPVKNHLLVWAAGFFSLGLCIGSFVMYALYGNKLESEKNMRLSLTAFNAGQSKLLSQQTRELSGLRNPPVVPDVVSPAGAPARPEPPAAAIATAPSVAAKPVPNLPKSFNPPNRAPVQTISQPAFTPRTVISSVPESSQPDGQKPSPPQAATMAEAVTLPPASEAAGAGGVTFEQAGIAGIDTTSVRFRSGRQINVGGEFPSGEKLLSVSPAEGKLVTDRRTILLAKPALAQ